MKSIKFKHQAAIFTLAIFANTTVFAMANDSSIKDRIIHSVNSHLEVVQKDMRIEQNKINLLDIDAMDSVRINFTTESNYSLTRNLNSFDSGYKDDYLNGILSVNSILYDNGLNDYSIKAEAENKAVSILERDGAFEDSLYKLLKLSDDIHSLEQKRSDLTETGKELEYGIDELKLRYKSGLGTITSIRDIQLEKLDLESSVNKITAGIEKAQNVIMSEFNFPKNFISKINLYSKSKTNVDFCNNTDKLSFDTKRIDSIKDHLNRSKNYELKKVKARNKPQLTGYTKLTTFDINSGFNKYDISAGIKLDFDLYNGGKSNIEQRKIQHRMAMKQSELDVIQLRQSTRYVKVLSACSNFKKQIANQMIKIEDLEGKIADDLFKAKLIDTDPKERIRTQLTLRKTQTNVEYLKNQIKQMDLEYLKLTESLKDRLI